jgi:hypothetical protein
VQVTISLCHLHVLYPVHVINKLWFVFTRDGNMRTNMNMSHPDLSLCLSPAPSRCRPYSPLSPVYLYLCSLFVCFQFVLFVKPTSVCFPVSACYLLLFFSPSQFWAFCLPWPWDCLPFCTLPHHPGLLTPACPDPETACCSGPFTPSLDY